MPRIRKLKYPNTDTKVEQPIYVDDSGEEHELNKWVHEENGKQNVIWQNGTPSDYVSLIDYFLFRMHQDKDDNKCYISLKDWGNSGSPMNWQMLFATDFYFIRFYISGRTFRVSKDCDTWTEPMSLDIPRGRDFRFQPTESGFLYAYYDEGGDTYHFRAVNIHPDTLEKINEVELYTYNMPLSKVDYTAYMRKSTATSENINYALSEGYVRTDSFLTRRHCEVLDEGESTGFIYSNVILHEYVYGESFKAENGLYYRPIESQRMTAYTGLKPLEDNDEMYVYDIKTLPYVKYDNQIIRYMPPSHMLFYADWSTRDIYQNEHLVYVRRNLVTNRTPGYDFHYGFEHDGTMHNDSERECGLPSGYSTATGAIYSFEEYFEYFRQYWVEHEAGHLTWLGYLMEQIARYAAMGLTYQIGYCSLLINYFLNNDNTVNKYLNQHESASSPYTYNSKQLYEDMGVSRFKPSGYIDTPEYKVEGKEIKIIYDNDIYYIFNHAYNIYEYDASENAFVKTDKIYLLYSDQDEFFNEAYRRYLDGDYDYAERVYSLNKLLQSHTSTFMMEETEDKDTGEITTSNITADYCGVFQLNHDKWSEPMILAIGGVFGKGVVIKMFRNMATHEEQYEIRLEEEGD